jgi:hypothetical protein
LVAYATQQNDLGGRSPRMARASSEYIAEAESLLAETKAYVEEERLIIVRRRELGSDLRNRWRCSKTWNQPFGDASDVLASLWHWAKQMDKLGGFIPRDALRLVSLPRHR